ncbi:MAG: class I SAM-dependent methyltransferase [Planctomycetes bacterium]|nr:class I SAM-dependent methyltransferase [Planctomycetota bacterium]MCW8134346.1 class I SAM-dependent methyltransferase [Planctomycetota bacterium]
MIRPACSDPALAQALGLATGGSVLVLEYAAGRLQLRDTRHGAPGPIFADFASLAAENRRKAGKGLLLAKAVGIRKQPSQVLDATAGLGRDAYALAALGCDVTAVERSPVVAALLQDALTRAAGDPAVARIRLVVGDARDAMQRARYEVVYLDPMFPERRKSAKVKKEMQYMQALLGDDSADDLLAPALACATRRVVVKRPVHAPTLAPAPKPSHVFKGKSVRFDVYAVAG